MSHFLGLAGLPRAEGLGEASGGRGLGAGSLHAPAGQRRARLATHTPPNKENSGRETGLDQREREREGETAWPDRKEQDQQSSAKFQTGKQTSSNMPDRKSKFRRHARPKVKILAKSNIPATYQTQHQNSCNMPDGKSKFQQHARRKVKIPATSQTESQDLRELPPRPVPIVPRRRGCQHQVMCVWEALDGDRSNGAVFGSNMPDRRANFQQHARQKKIMQATYQPEKHTPGNTPDRKSTFKNSTNMTDRKARFQQHARQKVKLSATRQLNVKIAATLQTKSQHSSKMPDSK